MKNKNLTQSYQALKAGKVGLIKMQLSAINEGRENFDGRIKINSINDLKQTGAAITAPSKPPVQKIKEVRPSASPTNARAAASKTSRSSSKIGGALLGGRT